MRALEHGIYEVLVTEACVVLGIMLSWHVTLDEYTFPCSPYFENNMDDESASGIEFSRFGLKNYGWISDRLPTREVCGARGVPSNHTSGEAPHPKEVTSEENDMDTLPKPLTP